MILQALWDCLWCDCGISCHFLVLAIAKIGIRVARGSTEDVSEILTMVVSIDIHTNIKRFIVEKIPRKSEKYQSFIKLLSNALAYSLGRSIIMHANNLS